MLTFLICLTATVGADRPVAQWSFPSGGETVPGPRPPEYPDFAADNTARHFAGKGPVRAPDSAGLRFTNGDTLSIEAWVKPDRINDGSHVYVIGKGRTFRKGYPQTNQNYALRLTGRGGKAHPSFLFHSAGEGGEWHRWTSDAGFVLDGRWHHIAVTYRFGDPKSIRGYFDGEPASGKWDMGGATGRPPVVDDDEVWIGASMGGSNGNSFVGDLDEVAIHRHALKPEDIAGRYRAQPPEPYVRDTPLPKGKILVEIFEGIGNHQPPTVPPTVEYTQSDFGFPAMAHKYGKAGVREDWRTPLMFRATGRVTLPPGEYQILCRARGDARITVDGEELISVPRLKLPGDGHGRMRDDAKIKLRGLHALWPGDNERLATFVSDGEGHTFRLTMLLGEQKFRPEPGESCVAVRTGDGAFRLLGFGDVPLTDEGWHRLAKSAGTQLREFDRRSRDRLGDTEQQFWAQRHRIARESWADRPKCEVPSPGFADAEWNAIDRFINAKLREAELRPAEAVDDWAFLRRVTVDVVGTVPTEKQIDTFFSFPEAERRSRYIDHLLGQPGWADNWVGYWQDVLAENPNVLKPTLNNTGPFRWWIYESFLDNKPIDRFATEAVMMRGSKYFGGPAGFAMAAENDAPMAAKAHVIGQAFLGLQMKCARCHDAPFHDFTQGQLFGMAAMLNRGPQEIPKTSSVPGSAEELSSLIVNVSLKPGSKIRPEWSFAELSPERLPDGVVRDPKDSREVLAGLITSPLNERFPKVIVNRLWRRYMGRGLVEPADDWEFADPSHPALLDYLARELVTSGYDLKHVARLILNSHAYQRQPIDVKTISTAEPYLFAGPVRRRMTAEQIVDSLFAVAGKDFNAGEINFSVDGANPKDTFLNLGRPTRAWQFASLSNERDRPSLSMPFAQDFVSTLETFGWRSSRQDPLTVRDGEPQVLQPAILANGVLTGRVTRLSDDGRLTELAVEEQPLGTFLDRLSRRTLTRPIASGERELFSELLRDGYDGRVIDVDPSAVIRFRSRPMGVSWSNHLSPEANEIKVKLEAMVRAGDPPSVRLKADWRERAEDVIWALVNTPEFVWLP